MTTRRMTKKAKLAIAAVVLVGGALAWFLLRPGKPQTGFFVGFHAIDDRRAVALIRANPKDGLSKGWVAVVDREDGMRWHKRLEGVPLTADFDGISLTAQTVSVRSNPDSKPQVVEQWSLDDGTRLWRHELPHFGDFSPAFSTIGSEDTLIEAVGHADGTMALHAIDRATGAEQEAYEFPSVLTHPHIVGNMLVLEELFYTRLYDLQTGNAKGIDTRGAGCFVDHDYYVIARRSDEQYVSRIDLADVSKVRYLAPAELPVIEGASEHYRVQACGRYEGALVFTIERARADSNNGLDLVAFDPSTGARLWHIDLGLSYLGGSIPQDSVYRTYRQSAPLSGELERYVPVMLDTYGSPGAPDQTRIAIVDLKERKIARESARSQTLIHFALMCRGQRCYLSGSTMENGGFVVAFDTTTGDITAAVQIPTLSMKAFLPQHLADGAIWVYASDYVPFGQMPWAVLDATTLEPLRNNGIAQIIDAREAISDWLKL